MTYFMFMRIMENKRIERRSIMFRFPLGDPRLALFGLTMFSHSNPGLEKQLEFFANMLEATRNSLAVIRGEMHNYQASMTSLVPQKMEYSTQPVQEQEDIPSNYTNPNQPTGEEVLTQQSAYSNVTTLDVKEEVGNQLEKQLDRLAQDNPEKINAFLNELEQLIKKYR
ncbi:hypothetical protein JCM14036_35370 [Desulfotomaculum defluvii]